MFYLLEPTKIIEKGKERINSKNKEKYFYNFFFLFTSNDFLEIIRIINMNTDIIIIPILSSIEIPILSSIEIVLEVLYYKL